MNWARGSFLMRNQIVVFISMVPLCSVAWGQAQNSAASSNQQSMPGMDMSGQAGHDMSKMPAKDVPAAGDKEAETEASTHVMNSMEGHMDMGPHMKMTALRQPKLGATDRAQQVVEAARKAADQYKDYHAALADGFKIFLPNIPQKMYHFTKYG